MTAELKNLRIDRSREPVERSRPLNSRARWVVAAAIGLAVAVMTGFFVSKLNTAPEVRVMRVRAASPSSAGGAVILSGTGYIVPAHKIEVAAKVIGKVVLQLLKFRPVNCPVRETAVITIGVLP